MIAVAEIPSHQLSDEELKNSLNIVLDDVSDPGNLGTIIRIADWFGIPNVICSEESTDCYNSKVVQAAMGSLFRVKVHYLNLDEFFEKQAAKLKLKVAGTVLNGENIYSTKLFSTGLTVFGSEARGIRKDLFRYITHQLHIPAYSKEDIGAQPDSLNVAVAAAIVCSEFRRNLK